MKLAVFRNNMFCIHHEILLPFSCFKLLPNENFPRRKSNGSCDLWRLVQYNFGWLKKKNKMVHVLLKKYVSEN